MSGFFLTLEGGEGSGKSTLSKALAMRLRELGRSVVTTREPGGTPLAEEVRDLVLTPKARDRWTPLAQALLMNTARADHIAKLINPSLERGDMVICDRFSDSTLAYQSIAGGVSMVTLRAIEKAVLENMRPDLTVLLDADPKSLLERRHSRGGDTDIFESESLGFHIQIREAFLSLAEQEPQRFLVLDALMPTEQSVATVMAEIASRGGVTL